MKKVINIETAPGKFVPTLVDIPDEPTVKVEEEKPKKKPRKRLGKKK